LSIIKREITNQQKRGAPTTEPYKKNICDNLNMLIGAKSFEMASQEYWNKTVKKELWQQFRAHDPSLPLSHPLHTGQF